MDILKFIILPPVVFVMIMLLMLVIYFILGRLSYKNPKNPTGKMKSYACGENISDDRQKVDYTQFFPFAFFFTIIHVIALLLATVPFDIHGSFCFVIIFIIIAFISIPILFRNEK